MVTKLSLVLMSAVLAGSLASNHAFAGGQRIRLTCGAEGGGDISMDARYQKRRVRAKFDGSFEAAPGGKFFDGDILPVLVGGVEVGSITLLTQLNGDLGGDIEFDTRPDELNPFPENFPKVHRGTSVVIGPLGCGLRP